MESAKLAGALRRMGIGAEAAEVYVALLDLAPAPLRAIAATAGLTEREVAGAYQELSDTGLVAAVVRDDDLAAPVPPTAALQILSRHRTAELDQSGIDIAAAFETFRRLRLAEQRDNLVEVVVGDSVGPRVRQAWRSARHQIRQFDTPPYFPMTGGVDDALTTLKRGITQRVIYSRASLEMPGNLKNNIEPCIAAGEESRLLPTLPVKLIVIDDAYALVSLSITEVDVYNTMLIVQPCGLLSALVALFEQSWQMALPFQGSATQHQRIGPSDRRLLSLLAGGVGDEDIARELGISRRTLFRRLEVLMARLGARTRVQMALQAQRRGWL